MKIKTFFSMLFFIFILNFSKGHNFENFTIRMPNVRPNVSEQYLCYSVKVNPDNSYYIVGFEPFYSSVTHHIVLFGCIEPESDKSVWECRSSIPCKSEDKAQIVSIFTRKYQLPDGLGLKMGKNSNIKYLILQTHYGNIDRLENGGTDDSGITLNITRESLTKSVGLYAVAGSGSIPPHGIEHMEAVCTMSENITLHPFLYSVHTHSLGKVVSGYVIKNNEWFELGKRKPGGSLFFETPYNGTIKQGDKIAIRCTMQSDRSYWTYSGFSKEEEMCNFFLMYYVENSELPHENLCVPPKQYWRDIGLTNIPDTLASSL